MNRYARQIALPEIGLTGQNKLKNAHIIMVGAGGLGAPALPYLAAAGIGTITIIDHDNIDLHNLHRQTIYRTDQIAKNKAVCAAEYCRALNPDITVLALTKKLTSENSSDIFAKENFDLILDGSDNFTTKSLLNDLSLSARIPLLSASVNGFSGQIGLFTGYEKDHGCYRCLFPEFPLNAGNCNDVGILGTSAGIVGMFQSHIALSFLCEIPDFIQGKFWQINLKTMHIENLNIRKDSQCNSCNKSELKNTEKKDKPVMIEMIGIENLNDVPTRIIDVRQSAELEDDPLNHPFITQTPLHIPLNEIPARTDELPIDQRLAFICAGNVRSRQAADYLSARGMENICILDKFSL